MLRALLFIILCEIAALPATASKPHRYYLDSVSGTNIFELIHMPSVKAETKAVEIRASQSGSRTGKASYGVIFAYESPTDYHSATLTINSDIADDGLHDDRSMQLTVSHHHGPETKVLTSLTLAKEIDLDNYDNSLAAELNCATGSVTILAGHSTLKPVVSLNIPAGLTQGSIGITASGCVAVSLAVGEYVEDPVAIIGPPVSDNLIESMISDTKDINAVGCWQYLDRNTDAAYIRPGGNYTIAIVPSPDDDDGSLLIIYLEGAQTNCGKWPRGQLKGKLHPTIFRDHYDLIWYDAELRPIADESSASLEGTKILRLDFPLHKSSIRFSKL